MNIFKSYLRLQIKLANPNSKHYHKSKKSITCNLSYKKTFQKRKTASVDNCKLLFNCILQLRNLALAFNIPQLTKTIMSASTTPLKLFTLLYDRNTSFVALHSANKRANPIQMMKYKLSLQLHNLYKDETFSKEWLSLS